MGSFASTCALSHLPIEHGDPVRFLLLQSSPFDARGNLAHGELGWYVRAPPIRARYNDYGSVGDIHPEDEPITKLWLAGLERDLVEKGVGENTAHDVATRRGMTFDELLTALLENRVEVRANIGDSLAESSRFVAKMTGKRPVIAKGIPTLRRVEAAIRKAGSVTYTVQILGDFAARVRGPCGYRCEFTPTEDARGSYDPRGFGGAAHAGQVVAPYTQEFTLDLTKLGNETHGVIVDELRRGEIRVRCGGYPSVIEESIRLYGLAKKLGRRYATIVSPDDGLRPALLVRPRPSTMEAPHPNGDRGPFRFGRNVGDERNCVLAAAMVREDVWQALLKLTLTTEDWTSHGPVVTHTIADYNGFARAAWSKAREAHTAFEATALPVARALAKLSAMAERDGNPIASLWNPSITGFGMDTSWAIFVESAPPEVAVGPFLSAIAQIGFVQRLLFPVRMEWRPGGHNGPQFGEWHRHVAFLRAMTSVAEERDRERRAEDEESVARQQTAQKARARQ